MKPGRLATSTIAAGALALLVGGIAGLVAIAVLTAGPEAENAPAAEDRQVIVPTVGKERAPTPSVAPTPTVESGPTLAPTPTVKVESWSTPTAVTAIPIAVTPTPTAVPTVLVESTPLPTATPTATVGPAPTATAFPTSKTSLGSTPKTGATALEIPDKSEKLVLQTDSPSIGDGPTVSGSGQGTVYTWQDGDATRRVVLQDALVVQETAANSLDDVVIVEGARDSIVQRQPRHGQETLPVFRSESGGELMTLPGGVLLALDPDWDQASVDIFLLENDISKDRTSELTFIQNGYFVETEPGFPSLDLANELVARDGVVISSPNWWREVQAK